VPVKSDIERLDHCEPVNRGGPWVKPCCRETKRLRLPEQPPNEETRGKASAPLRRGGGREQQLAPCTRLGDEPSVSHVWPESVTSWSHRRASKHSTSRAPATCPMITELSPTT
jgi:hypothetical protein